MLKQLHINTIVKRFNGRDMRYKNKGSPTLILPGSSEGGIIADWMEDNTGFRNTTVMVNQHRRGEGRRPVWRNTVMNAFDRMDPILTNSEKCAKETTRMRNGG